LASERSGDVAGEKTEGRLESNFADTLALTLYRDRRLHHQVFHIRQSP